MSKTTLPHPSHTMPAGTKVCHRTYGIGRVLPAQPRGASVLVEFDSGAVTSVAAADLVPLPPEGFEPEFDSDGQLMFYKGPTIEGRGVTVSLDWNPDEGTLFWLTPEREDRRDDEIYTIGQIRELVGMLQEILEGHDGK